VSRSARQLAYRPVSEESSCLPASIVSPAEERGDLGAAGPWQGPERSQGATPPEHTSKRLVSEHQVGHRCELVCFCISHQRHTFCTPATIIVHYLEAAP
jgi:hypothetical protein